MLRQTRWNRLIIRENEVKKVKATSSLKKIAVSRRRISSGVQQKDFRRFEKRYLKKKIKCSEGRTRCRFKTILVLFVISHLLYVMQRICPIQTHQILAHQQRMWQIRIVRFLVSNLDVVDRGSSNSIFKHSNSSLNIMTNHIHSLTLPNIYILPPILISLR